MIFPIGDQNVKGGHYPIVSYAFLALNIIVFLVQIITPGNLICSYGSIPANIAQGNDMFTLISSMFLHGDWMHLIGNMLFLWVFADNIEAVIGNLMFFLFYVGGGIIAAFAHIFFSIGEPSVLVDCCTICANVMPANCGNLLPCSGSVPTVGASGSISAVLGAYFIMFPGSKIKVLFFIRTFTISALLFLGFWIAQQLFSGFAALGAGGTSSGVAWWAHIGGFVFGILMGFLFKKWFPKIDLIKRPAPLGPKYQSRRKGF